MSEAERARVMAELPRAASPAMPSTHQRSGMTP